ncbi:MAG: S1C family serine protease [Acidimicrobiales bacterium]|nr:S1C family serine protease [Acidimicrobiales bacterium]
MSFTAQSLSTAIADATTTVVATAGPSVVRVGQHGGRGCGVVVADGFVLTNSHNMRDRTTAVTFADRRVEQGSVMAVDVDGDLVVLAVATAGTPAIPWADAPSAVGHLAFAVVRTSDGGARVTVGTLSRVDGAFRGPRGRPVEGSLEHTAPLARGSSGSPLVDADGRLLGLNTARLGGAFYAALPADEALRGRVDALLRGESPQRRTLGLGLAPAEVAAKLRAAVGLPERAGLLVRSVDPNGAAASAGVQVGDLLSGAAGRSVTTTDDVHRALDDPGAAAVLDLLLVRGVEELTVRVGFEPAAEQGES